MIVGLFPELLSVGGVQRAGRHTAAVLAACAAERGTPYRFLSLNDPPGLHPLHVGGCDFAISGFERGKARFVWAALRAAHRRPALILAAHPNLAPVALAMKRLAPRARTVVLTHGIEVWEPLGLWRRRALVRADGVLAPSRYTARRLVTAQGVPEEKIRIVAWGLDPEFTAPLPPADTLSPPDGFPSGRVILTVGRWAANERYKGVDMLIQALPLVLRDVADLSLVAVGDGDDRPRLERLAASVGLAGRVHFLDGLAQKALIACYARCDVFALPSRGEGFGLVFLEAMSQGKPVIGGAHGGIPDVVEDGRTGFLVPYGDVQQLAHALRTLLTDDALCAQMGRSARERVETEYQFEQFAGRLKEALADLCAS